MFLETPCYLIRPNECYNRVELSKLGAALARCLKHFYRTFFGMTKPDFREQEKLFFFNGFCEQCRK